MLHYRKLHSSLGSANGCSNNFNLKKTMKKLIALLTIVVLTLATIIVPLSPTSAGENPLPSSGTPHGTGITHGTVINGASFNNYTDGYSGVTDERRFLIVINETTGTLYTNTSVPAAPGDLLKVSMFINNNGNADASGLRAFMRVPFFSQGTSISIGGYLRAENAVVDATNAAIKTISDAITIQSTTSSTINLAYIWDSARFIQMKQDLSDYNIYGCGYPVSTGCKDTKSLDYYVANPSAGRSLFAGSYDGTNLSNTSGIQLTSNGAANLTTIFDNTGQWSAGDRYLGVIQVWLVVGQADTVAPTFGGLQSATATGNTTVNLAWNAASDNKTAAGDILYDIYGSTTSGGQNFASGAQTFVAGPGVTSFTAYGLSAGTTYYFVVRARDTAGNRDGNTREMSATTLEQSNQSP